MMTRSVKALMVMAVLAAPASVQGQESARALAAVDAARAGHTVAATPALAAVEAERRADEATRQDRERERDADRQERERSRENALFDEASRMMDAARWDRAVDAFTRIAELSGTRVDGALYWKAYSQDRIGQRAEALATLAALTKSYPASRFVKQAQALEVEVRRRVGQPVSPDAVADDELKLMALNAILSSDPEKAIPILEKLLQGPSSPRVRERAVFVLAQSTAPRARQLLTELARGTSTPDLQNKAIQYLGVMRSAESKATLAEVYAASNDVDIKRRILRAFMTAGEKSRLLTAAQTESNVELRGEAVRQLGSMSANDELWQLYQKEATIEVKKQILQALFVGGNATRMVELARTEKGAELRAVAVRNLGLMGGAKTGDALTDIYGTDADPAIRKAVINALSVQGNAPALVTLARKENDGELKKAIVQKLSTMRNKVATDYMLELLNK